MRFNLNQFLMSASTLIDFVEMDVLGVTSNHGRRVAYIAARLGERANLLPPQIFDLVALAILHDNGLSEETLLTDFPLREASRLQRVEGLRAHCDLGERNVAGFPFLTETKGSIQFHHERHDGRGFFGLRGEDVPLMAQLIGLADYVDFLFHFETPDPANRNKIRSYISENRSTAISPALTDLFLDVSAKPAFWLDLQNDFIDGALARLVPDVSVDIPYAAVLEIGRVFSRIVDCKSRFTQRHSSGLEDKTARMAEALGFDDEHTIRLRIAAAFHDLGKLAMPNSILDKPSPLTHEEILKMQEHTYYTRRCLEKVSEFKEITEWASNHHEKLDGSGYPLGLAAADMVMESRLLCCLDIYQALTEDRPYRKPMSHAEAMAILQSSAARGLLDVGLVQEVDRVFAD